jgi:predicted MFS family arabinose efflux permease
MALPGGAVISLVLVTSWGGTTYARTPPVITALGAAALALGAAWLVSARHAADPVIPLRLFRDQTFRIAGAISLITGIGMSGAISYLPAYLQIVTSVSATISGLLLLPLIAGLLVTSVASGRLIARTGHHEAYPVAGTALAAAGLHLLSTMGVRTSHLPPACTCWSWAWASDCSCRSWSSSCRTPQHGATWARPPHRLTSPAKSAAASAWP